MRVDIEMKQLCTEGGDMRYVVGFANESTFKALLENTDAAKSREQVDKLVYGSIDPKHCLMLSYFIAEYSRK